MRKLFFWDISEGVYLLAFPGIGVASFSTDPDLEGWCLVDRDPFKFGISYNDHWQQSVESAFNKIMRSAIQVRVRI
jgi:hypothetical protein